MSSGEEVVRGRRRGVPWHRVSRGLYRLHSGGVDDLDAWRLVLPPSGRFTHVTGAGLHGLWMPPLPSGLPVFAAMDRAESRPQRPGLLVTRHVAVPPAVTCRDLPVDPVPEVLLACARHLQLVDLVVLVDSALQLERCTVGDIEELAGRRRRGAPRLRQALALSDGRSESPYESLLRLLHVACGIQVEPQFVLRDQSGGFVARADLWVVGTRALHEYDGDVHLTRAARRTDLRRERRIGNEVWVRRGYTAAEVLRQGVSILRDADLSLGRPHDPAAIRTWHSWLAASLFTPAGRELLRHELGLRTASMPSGDIKW